MKKYFTTNVKPDLEVKLNQIKYELYEIIKQESKENAQKNLIEILKNQQDFESKSSIILNDCNSRTKEIEVIIALAYKTSYNIGECAI